MTYDDSYGCDDWPKRGGETCTGYWKFFRGKKGGGENPCPFTTRAHIYQLLNDDSFRTFIKRALEEFFFLRRHEWTKSLGANAVYSAIFRNFRHLRIVNEKRVNIHCCCCCRFETWVNGIWRSHDINQSINQSKCLSHLRFSQRREIRKSGS